MHAELAVMAFTVYRGCAALHEVTIMCILDVTLTKEWLSDRFLQGVKDFDPSTGQPLTVAFYDQAIRQGREQTEGEFDVALCPVDIEGDDGSGTGEKHDLTEWSSTSQFLTNLNTKPLISITSVAEYGLANEKLRDLTPENVVVCSAKLGQVQYQGGDAPLVRNYRGCALRWKYRAGFTETVIGTVTANKDSFKVTGTGFRAKLKIGDLIGFDGSEGRTVSRIVSDTEVQVDRAWSYQHTAAELLMQRVPSIFLEYLGIVASLKVLATAGDLVIGAGISSMSRSQDGQSQSVQTTASPENNAYSARMRQLDKQLEELWRRGVRDWRPQEMFVM